MYIPGDLGQRRQLDGHEGADLVAGWRDHTHDGRHQQDPEGRLRGEGHTGEDGQDGPDDEGELAAEAICRE